MAPTSPQQKCPNEIWEKIFSYLKHEDKSSLLGCRETCSDFKFWVDKRTTFWDQMPLKRAVEENNLAIVEVIMENAQDKNPADEDGWTPLHEAAKRGYLEIFSLIFENTQDKNPASTSGFTPLHLAAEDGHLDICRLIIENVQDKNPVNGGRETPLHERAMWRFAG